MSVKKVKLSAEEEEMLIEFVKNNEVLYNVKHKEFRDSEKRNRLWLRVANDLGLELEVVKTKWKAIRDYYMRPKKSTGSAASTSKRDESLSFLNQTAVVKRATQSSVPVTVTSVALGTVSDPGTPTDSQSLTLEVDNSDAHSVFSNSESIFDGPPSVDSADSGSSRPKRKRAQSSGEILREIFANRPKISDFIQQPVNDDTQKYCDSLAVSLRKLSPLAFARAKMKINRIVDEEEFAWAESQSVQCIYVNDGDGSSASTAATKQPVQQLTPMQHEMINSGDMNIENK